MAEEIRVRIEDREIQQKLQQMAQRAANLRPLMVRIAGHMLDAVQQNFESEGRPRWPGLRPSTIRARARKGKWPGPILRVTGQLAASVSRRATATEAIVGTNKVYAPIHQFGGEVSQPGGSGSVRLRTDGRGRLVRGKRGGAVFARRGHRRAVERGFSFGGHTIRIPARPFLRLGADDLARIRRDVTSHMIP